MKWELKIEGDSLSELLSVLPSGKVTVVADSLPLSPVPNPMMAKAPEAAKTPEATKREPAKAPEATKTPEPKKPEAAKEEATLDMCIKMYNTKKAEGMTGNDAKALAAEHGGTKISDVPKENIPAFYVALSNWKA